MAKDNFIGKQIGNYRISEEIAAGSFGRVYKGVHVFLTKRIVAIKILHRTFLSSQRERDSFLQEANLLEMLKQAEDLLDVFFFENHALAGALAARLLAGGRRPGDDRSTPEGVKRRHEDAAKTLTVGDQQRHRHDAPGHSEHGQETSRGLAAKGGPSLK